MEAENIMVGFRSAFRDWSRNETHFPREVAEHALADVMGARLLAPLDRPKDAHVRIPSVAGTNREGQKRSI
jgi:hypothetical protein